MTPYQFCLFLVENLTLCLTEKEKSLLGTLCCLHFNSNQPVIKEVPLLFFLPSDSQGS